MNIVKDRGGSWKDYSLAFAMMGGASVLGAFAGHRIGQKLGARGGAAMMGVALSVVMWIVVMELMPEALDNSSAWFVPALWLAGMGGGIGLDWMTEFFDHRAAARGVKI
jgi:zinc transporter ZupT